MNLKKGLLVKFDDADFARIEQASREENLKGRIRTNDGN